MDDDELIAINLNFDLTSIHALVLSPGVVRPFDDVRKHFLGFTTLRSA